MSKFPLRQDLLAKALVASAVIGMAVSYGDLYLFHVVLLCLLGTQVLLIGLGQRGIIANKTNTKVQWGLYIFALWQFTSGLWTADFEWYVKYVFWLLCGVSITATIFWYADTHDRLIDIYNIIKITVICQVSICLLEIFGLFRLPISPYSPHLALFGREIDSVTSDIIYVKSQSQIPSVNLPLKRATGFLWNPNNMAAAATMILPFAICGKYKLRKLALATSCLLIIFTSGSRASILAVIIMIGIRLTIYSRKTVSRYALLLLLPACIIISSMLDLSDSHVYRPIADAATAAAQYIGGTDWTDNSVGIRVRLISRGIDALIQSGGLGVGAGGSHAIQADAIGLRGITALHNFWIEIFVEGGVLMGILFVGWYSTMTAKLYKIGRNHAETMIRYFGSALSLSLVGFSLAVISTATAIYFFPMWILFGAGLATINVSRY